MLKNSPPTMVNPSQGTSSEATRSVARAVFEEMISDTFAKDGIGAAAAGEQVFLTAILN